jgi:ribosomal protein L16/L10AE
MDGVSREKAFAALRLAGYKLPFKTKIIAKGDN